MRFGKSNRSPGDKGKLLYDGWQTSLIPKGRPMEISADRAYWLLQSFCTRSVRLHFGGRIGGEDATCDAAIVAVDRELQIAVVELLEAGGARSWCRPIPLRDASFHLSMLGEPDFHEWEKSPFHLVLVLQYSDATTLLFAERASSDRRV